MTKTKKIILIVASIVMLLSMTVLVLINYALPQIKYNKALSFMQQEKYDFAVEEFSSILQYRDSAQKVAECNEISKEETYLEARSAERLMRYELAFSLYASIGSYKDSVKRKDSMRIKMQNESLRNATSRSIVYFGSYEQDNNLENGKEPIKWVVIATKGSYLQLLSLNALDAQQYHNEFKAITWENCSLRAWLNIDFYNAAFISSERALIVPWWNTSEHRTAENTTVLDSVFLITANDVKRYVPTNYRQCIPTPYAIAQGVYQSPDGEQCRWLIRTPGEFMFNVQCVYFDGGFFARGNDVDYKQDGLRPSVWINKSALNYG